MVESFEVKGRRDSALAPAAQAPEGAGLGRLGGSLRIMDKAEGAIELWSGTTCAAA